MSLSLERITPKQLFYITAITLGLSAIYNMFIPLHGDEAYYWLFSKHLQWGYYDHPALIAYYIHLFTYFSDAIFFVRLGNIVAYAVVLWVLYDVSKRYISPKAAPIALLVMLSIPLFHAATLIITPDTVLMLTYSLTLYTVLLAFRHEQTTHYFLLAGLFLGLAMMAKYTALLLAVSIVFYALLFQRSLLLNYRFYLAVLTAGITVIPLIWWNYTHDWISFMFQLHHGGMGKHTIHIDKFLAFFGGQVGIFTPTFFIIALIESLRIIKHPFSNRFNAQALFAVTFLQPLLFFSYKSFFQSMEINYAAPIYLTATLLNATFFLHVYARPRFKALLHYSLLFALLLSLGARYAMMFKLIYVQDRMVGFKEAVSRLEHHIKEGDAFYGNHLTTAALLSYYLHDHPDADVGIDSRFSQYDLWRQNSAYPSGLFLSYEPIESALSKHFSTYSVVDTYPVYKGSKLFKTFYVYRVNAKLTPK